MSKKGTIIIQIFGLCMVGLLAWVLVSMIAQFTHPSTDPRLQMEVDIPLPGALPDSLHTAQHPLAPGLAVSFDHFDFMGIDYQTHLLFIAHTGPAPDREAQVNPKFNLQTDVKDDGNVVVFNIVEKKVVGLLPIPQAAGVVVAPDLHKVYVADNYENIVYVIDEQTLTYRPIPLQANDSPDSITYDLSDHLVLVSDPGTPPTVDTNIIARKNQNETLIDAHTDRVVGRIPLGVDGQWGDDVGFARYDPGLRRAFVVVQQLPDPNSPNPSILPPPGTAWIVEFDPRTRQVITRTHLPYGCLTPHGMDLDTVQHIAFIACIDANPSALIRFNLQTLQTIAEPTWPTAIKPDMVVFDQPLGVVYVGCGAGVSVFQEHATSFKWLATYTYGMSTHTLAINEQTQEMYLPLPREGGRPVLRILRFNLNGTL